MSDDKKEVPLGSGLAELARRKLKGRGRQIDAAVDQASDSRKRMLKDLDNRIAAARAANNQDLVNKYMARKKALEAL